MNVCPNSAFFERLQLDTVDIVEVIDLTLPSGDVFHWTTCNQEITYTLSGAPTIYRPFPGATPTGVKQSYDMSVAVIDFVIQNSGPTLQGMLGNSDFARAAIQVGRVFASTPNLGRMEMYTGQVGDFSFNRAQLKGQARNIWKSLNVQWPYLSYGDNCAWRFGSRGCGVHTSSITIAIGSVNVGSSTTIDILLPAGTLTGSYASGRFDFGRLTVTAGVNSGQIRTIRSHSGDLLSLSNDLPSNDFTGMQVSIYPGCRKRVMADCHSIHNNARNAIGFPWIPAQEDAY